MALPPRGEPPYTSRVKFPEFYRLLDEILTKRPCGVAPTEDNFDAYLMNRYVSFYSPALAAFVDSTANRLGFFECCGGDPAAEFRLLKAVVPRVPSRRVKYVSRKREDAPVDNTALAEYALAYGLSLREVEDMVETGRLLRERGETAAPPSAEPAGILDL